MMNEVVASIQENKSGYECIIVRVNPSGVLAPVAHLTPFPLFHSRMSLA